LFFPPFLFALVFIIENFIKYFTLFETRENFSRLSIDDELLNNFSCYIEFEG